MSQQHHPPLAIIGMACCLPGAPSLSEYWKLLVEGRCALRRLPPDRLDRDLYFDAKKGRVGKTYIDTAGLIEYPAFDPTCCNYPARLMRYADVGHLMMCQVAADACRHAGLDPFDLPLRNAGVYIGNNSSGLLATELSYAALAAEAAAQLHSTPGFRELTGADSQAIVDEVVDRVRRNRPRFSKHGPMNVAFHVTANAVSESLGLSGPSMVLDAACSSSLKALAMAARELWLGSIDMAVVGGASFCSSDGLLIFSSAQAGSPRGVSCPFSDEADGLVSAEGYAAVVVKMLERALADGDPIQCVVRGIGVSSDGRGKSLWAPRAEGQVKAVERAYGYGAEMARVAFLEGHATSTSLGDQTELDAMALAFGPERSALPKIPISGVKANIGHVLEPSGLAGLIKAALVLQCGVTPRQINCLPLNSSVDWLASPFYVPTENEPLAPSADGRPRQAAVNAFGIGGLNAHVVIEEAGDGPSRAPAQRSPATRSRAPESYAEEPIAIIGVGCLYPGARTLDAFADLVYRGEDPKQDAPADRWDAAVSFSSGEVGAWTTPTRRGGFIADYQHDWRRHKIAPKVLKTANPLQFMLLDCCDAALLDAGYRDRPFDNETTAVMVGARFETEFTSQLCVGFRLPELRRDIAEVLRRRGLAEGAELEQLLEDFQGRVLERMPALVDDAGSFTPSSLCSRLTKTYNLMGGGGSIDSGNTVALAAVAQSVAALRTRACGMMLCAIGSRAMGLTTYLRMAHEGNLAHADPASRLDNNAHGRVPGEAAGVLVLKRLSDARRDGDPIRGVIHGVGAAFSASPREAFDLAMDRAWRGCRVKKSSVRLVELSAAGPDVLDAELDAIARCYPDSQVLVSDSATQFGDSLGASGLTSLLKATVELERKALPVEFGLQAARNLPHKNVALATRAAALATADDAPLLAGVSSWDNCGSAYHLVLERGAAVDLTSPGSAAPARVADEPDKNDCLAGFAPWKLVRLEARSLDDLVAQAESADPEWLLARVSEAFSTTAEHRLAVVCRDVAELGAQLKLFVKLAGSGPAELLERRLVFYGTRNSVGGKLAVLFAGQGSQYAGMLKGLLEACPLAAGIVEELDGTLLELGFPAWADLAYVNGDQLGADVFRTQLSLLVADTALFRLLGKLGARPDVVAGHSFGEFPALCAAGAWDFRSAALATKARCDAIQACSGVNGGMLSCNADDQAAAQLCEQTDGLAYPANLNAADQTVIGGTAEGLERVRRLLVQDGFVAKLLPVNRPYHTPLMSDVMAPLRSALATISTGAPAIPLLSSVTNEYVRSAERAIENLVEQLTRPVRYRDLVARLVADGVTTIVECGPRTVLTGLHSRHELSDRYACIATDDPKRDGVAMLLGVRAMLEVRGLTDAHEQSAVVTSARAMSSAGEMSVAAEATAWAAEQRAALRQLLRRQVQSKRRPSQTLDHRPVLARAEVHAIAAGARVNPRLIAAHCNRQALRGGANGDASCLAILRRSVARGSGRIGSNGAAVYATSALDRVVAERPVEPSLFDSITPNEFRQACGVDDAPRSPAHDGAQTCRFLPRVMVAPLPRIDLGSLAFNGRVLILGENPTARELARLIARHGGKPEVLSNNTTEEEALQRLDQLWREGPLPHLYVMTACDPDATTSTAPEAWSARQRRGMMLPFRVTSHWFRLLSDSQLVEQGSIHAATLLGGDFGFSGQAVGVEGGAIAGLVKSLIHEAGVPTGFKFQTTLVDFSGAEPPAERAELLLKEVAARPAYELEAGYAGGARRLVRPVPAPAAPAAPAADAPIPSGAWVVTGGARGITAFVAHQVAVRHNLRVHLLGSSPAPSVPDDWRGLDEPALKLKVMQQARAEGVSPADAWRSASRMLELDASLAAMRAAGVQADYHQCDVSDHQSLAAALERVRESDGPISGVLHGAGIEVSGRLQTKDPDIVRRTLEVKTKSAASLIELTADDPVRHFIAFGSITGRVGCPGQSDYAMANEALAKLLAWHARRRPDCRVTCFDWGPWEEIGMAVRPETRGGAVMGRLTGTPPAEGLSHFLAELTAEQRSTETMIVGWDVYRIFYTDHTPEARLPLPAQAASNDAPRAATAQPGPAACDGEIRRYVMRWAEVENRPANGAGISGRALVVGDNPDASALATLLRSRGVPVSHYKRLEGDQDNSEAESIVDRHWRGAPITHVFLVTARDADAPQIDVQQVWSNRARVGLIAPYRLLSAWLRRASREGTLGESAVVGLTSLGGDCGFESGPDAIEGAGLAGVLKAVHAEHGGGARESLRVKVIDAPADESPDSLAHFALDEALGECDEVEVCLVRGRRRLPRLLPHRADGLPTNPPKRGGVWVVTGGARGITAEVVRGLGKKYGLRLHLLGRRPPPRIDESIRYLSDEELKPHKRQVVRDAIKQGVKPEDAWGPIRRDFEIDRNLRSMASEGIDVTYHECDVTNRERLAEVLDDVRRRHGPISGVIHGAGIQGIPTTVRDMLESSVKSARETLSIKVRAMLDLLELTEQDPLEFCVGFGSISGRFGSNSASFYCAGTDMLCKIMGRVRRQRPQCRAVGFHWHGWSDVGMITTPEGFGTAQVFKLELLRPADGVQRLIDELEAGAPEAEVVITNPTYITLYHPRRVILPERPAEAHAGRLGPAPMLRSITPHPDGSSGVVAELELDPATDPFLVDHRYGGSPLLPAVMALEAFAEAAEAALPGARVSRFHDLQLHSGLRMHAQRKHSAKVVAESGGRFVKCQLTADFMNRRGEVVDPGRLHASAVVEVGGAPTPSTGQHAPCEAEWHDVWYPEPTNLMYHGPVFQCLKRCAFNDRGEAWGELVASHASRFAGDRGAEGWRLHPPVIDAALYLCGVAVWASNSNAVALPHMLDCLHVGRSPRAGEACHVYLRTCEADDRHWVFDLTVHGANSDLLYKLDGYRCQNVLKPATKH